MTLSATVNSLSRLSDQQKAEVIAAASMQVLGAASGLTSTVASIAVLAGKAAASSALIPAAVIAGIAMLADPTLYLAMDKQRKALDSLKGEVSTLKDDKGWDSTLEDLLLGYEEKQFAGNVGALAAKTALTAASTALGAAGLAGNPVAMVLAVIAGIGAALTDVCQAAAIRNQRHELGESIIALGVDKLFSGNFDNQNSKYVRDNIEKIRAAYAVDSSDTVVALGGQSFTKLALQLAATATSSNNWSDMRAGDPIFAQVKSSMTNFANVIKQDGSQVVANLFDFSNGFANLSLALNKTQANSSGRYVTNIYLYNPLAAAGTERREVSRGKNSTDVRTYLDGAKGWTFDTSQAVSGSTISFDTRNTIAEFGSTQLSNKFVTGGTPDVNYQFRASTATYIFDNRTASPAATAHSSAILSYEGYAGALATRTENVRKMVANAQRTIDDMAAARSSWNSFEMLNAAESIAPGLAFQTTKDAKNRDTIQYITPQMKEAAIVVSNSYGNNELVINKRDAIGAEYFQEYIGSHSQTNGKETTTIQYLAAQSRKVGFNYELGVDRAYSINSLVATAGDDILSGYDGMALYGGRGKDTYLVKKATSSVPNGILSTAASSTTGSTSVQQNHILSIVAGSTTDSTVIEQNKIVLSGVSGLGAITFAMSLDQTGLVVLNGENNEIVYVQNWSAHESYKKYEFVIQSGKFESKLAGDQVFSAVNSQLTTGLQAARTMAASLAEIMPTVDWESQLVNNASSAYVNATTIVSSRSDYQKLASDTTTHVFSVSSNESSRRFSGDTSSYTQISYEGLTSGIQANFSAPSCAVISRGATSDSLTNIQSLIGTSGDDTFANVQGAISIETAGGHDRISISSGAECSVSMSASGLLDIYLGLASGWKFDQVDGVGGMVTITTYDTSNTHQSSIRLLNAQSNFAVHADSLVANAAAFGSPLASGSTFAAQQNTAIHATSFA